jgi:hypothetical protein
VWVTAAAVVLVAGGSAIAYAATADTTAGQAGAAVGSATDHPGAAGMGAMAGAAGMGAMAGAAGATGTTVAASATSSASTTGVATSKPPAGKAPATGKGQRMAPAGTVVDGVDISGFPTQQRGGGIFTDRCGYSHSAADDPILAPGKAGQSMHHDFFGNTGTTASSTAASLIGGPTTCTTTADSSAYWIPVMYQNGTALTPESALIYWRQDRTLAPKVTAIPAGLEMIAGDESATAPQPLSVISWTCTPTKANPFPGKGSATPHDCAGTGRLRLTVHFPSCWDGHALDGAGQTNVVYPTASGCPASHPVAIPQIVFHVVFPTSSAANLTLSMTPTMTGSTNTEHVDFVNGWRQSTMDADTAACVATATRCGPVTGPQATPHGPSLQTLVDERARQLLEDRAKARHPGGH